MNLKHRISQAKSQLVHENIARRFGVSRSFVTHSINGNRNSKKAKEIRRYVSRLVSRNRLAA